MWNPSIYDLVAYNLCVGIIMSGYKRGTTRQIRIMNIYALYTRRKQFWDRVTKYSVFGLSSIIIVGDLNFSMGPIEIWGNKA